jgi:cyclic beta-1,2-glucan synthetase
VLSSPVEARAPTALCQEIVGSLGEPTSASADELGRWGEVVRGWALGKLNGDSTWSTDEQAWLTSLAEAADQGVERVEALHDRLSGLAKRAHDVAHEMDFSFLYDRDRKVFSIGYNLADSRLDASFYDLLASESRLASFVAIAKGDVPSAHWYRLGRPLGQLGNRRALLSWTGTMFEYLMPCLVMKTYPGTLLDRTCRAVIRRQMDYGEQLGLPWGTSEAAYNARDLQLNYQYGPFGVPGLGIKRGLGDDMVVAPYASALALQFAPAEAVQNLRRLAHAGLDGRYGFYESIDYTPSRLADGQTSETVRAFMAHHQGMTLVAIAEHLDGGAMRERFHSEPSVQATQLLLQERMPHHVPLAELNQQESTVLRTQVDATPNRYGLAFDVDAAPEVHLLSNGVYSVMVTTSGAGSSRCRGLMVTRWREDATRDHWGQFCYLRDVESGKSWSTTYQPMLGKPRAYEVDVDLDKAEFRRVENGIASRVVISVSSEDNAELRSVKLTNLSGTTREVELTTYAEIVLASAAADSAHPTFGNLFVHTEFLPGSGALLATRRARSASDVTVWAVHVSATDGDGSSVGAVQYETDRARFLGRGRGPNAPIAVVDDRPLSNTVGPVLDPIFSLRRRIRLVPGQSAQVVFTTALADTRAQAIALAEKYQHAEASRRASELAWTNARAELHYLNIGGEETRIFSKLASRMIYAHRYLRSSPELLARNEGCQADLWRYGISGDLPIIAVRVSVDTHVELVRQLLHAHEYWRRRGFQVDLVVLNEHAASYLQSFQDQLLSLVRSSMARELIDRPGGVFVLRNDIMSEKDRTLVRTVARVVLAGERGTILEQVEREPPAQPLPPLLAPRRPVSGSPAALMGSNPRQLAKETTYFNGSGGFADDGGEYRIVLSPHQWTPVPWSNVIANARFGTLVTDSGGGYTWCDNSRENRLTPWSNDPVSDGVGEAIYVRDEDTGAFFTPTALPVRGPQPYHVRHGQGYSIFETSANGLELSLLVCVPTDDPVKLSRLTLRNRFPVKRRLTVTYYVEWTLGVLREASAPYVVTSITRGSVLTARNAYNNEFAPGVAFVSASTAVSSFTGDRCEFIGRGGHLGKPVAMSREGLSGRLGAGLDPCGALQIEVELAPGEERDVVFTLGEGVSLAEAEGLATRYRAPMSVCDALSAARARWSDVLDTIQVETPDTPFDYLVNRWLLYQTMGCRLWARTGFYQSGGAYGFRDQLQDVAALVYAAPQVARAQLLRAAARQFVEGDVQHWWHPPTGRGVRTRFSDDLLWLPYILSHYLEVTGDAAVLDEAIPFIESRPLADKEDDAYLVPSVSETEGSLYEHCTRALDRSLVTGSHGLPLIGSGDWNDGMNRVGHHGRGESVWLAWFLHSTLVKFAPMAQQRGDATRAARYLAHAATLAAAVEGEAWDGEWYTRAYMDDGTPLGSSRSEECQIDSIAQTWSVISGAADPARQRQAMASVEKHLIKQKDELILLFTPPFDKTDIDPGYIKGYLPGTRENGGQYTHAAVWVVLAYALLGEGNRAGELFALLNPVNRTATRAGAQRYKVEPYVIAADVYSQPPHTGRGGWTWYTGSASWMYRVAVEAMLGLRLRGDTLVIDPCVPSSWPKFTIVYRHHQTTYRIVVENPDRVCKGVRAVELDGASVEGGAIALVRDRQEHNVRVTLGAAPGRG